MFNFFFLQVKDLDVVLLDLASLLNENNPDYVRDFAAQSFAFVARKVKDKNKLLSLVLYAMQTSPQVGFTLNVKNYLNLCVESVCYKYKKDRLKL